MANAKRNFVRGRGHQRHISVRAVRRDQADLRKLSRALMQYAVEQAAAEAAAQQQHEQRADDAPEPEHD